MKTWVKFSVMAVVIITAAISVVLASKTIERLTAQRDRYRNNTETLLGEVETYKVRDSLHAARVQSLELTVKEFERFRADDAKLIRELKGRNRDLAAINKTQAQTIIDLQAEPVDTFIIRDSIRIPAVAVHCGDAWFDFSGLLMQDNFTGTLHNRDSLIVAETVKYKRFLGFLWKTHKVKDRQLDVVSLNPHTQIVGVEYIFIEK